MSEDEARIARARVIAEALARTSEHHRKTAIYAGLVALVGCGLGFWAGEPAAKAVALAVAVLFAVSCYRSMRSSNAYVDPAASPVLKAIAGSPQDVSKIELDASRSLVSIHAGEHVLAVRVDDATQAEPLLEALAAHAPVAEITRW